MHDTQGARTVRSPPQMSMLQQLLSSMLPPELARPDTTNTNARAQHTHTHACTYSLTHAGAVVVASHRFVPGVSQQGADSAHHSPGSTQAAAVRAGRGQRAIPPPTQHSTCCRTAGEAAAADWRQPAWSGLSWHGGCVCMSPWVNGGARGRGAWGRAHAAAAAGEPTAAAPAHPSPSRCRSAAVTVCFWTGALTPPASWHTWSHALQTSHSSRQATGRCVGCHGQPAAAACLFASCHLSLAAPPDLTRPDLT